MKKKINQRIIAFLAAAAISLSFAGCGKNDNKSPTDGIWSKLADSHPEEETVSVGADDLLSTADAQTTAAVTTAAADTSMEIVTSAEPRITQEHKTTQKSEPSGEPRTTQKAEPSRVTSISSPKTVKTEETFPSNEQAKVAVKELFEKAYQYAKEGNREGFASLYADADKMSDTVNEEYNGFAKLVKKNYPDFDSTIMFGKDGYYIAYIINSVSSASGNNTSAMWDNYLMPVSYQNGEWRFDLSEKAAALQNDEGFWNFLPKPAVEAIKAGRDGSFFDNDKNEYYWVNEDIVIPKLVQGKIYIVWKNEDGSLSVLVNFNNGSDSIKVFKKGSIKISVDDIGDVLDVTFDPDVALAPGTCTNKVFTFGADQLKNNSGWGGRGVHCERVFIF